MSVHRKHPILPIEKFPSLVVLCKKSDIVMVTPYYPIFHTDYLSSGRSLHRHHHVLFSVREIGPCVLSRQASLTQVQTSIHALNPNSSLYFPQFFSRSPQAFLLVFSHALFLNTCPINFQRLHFICCVISSIFVLNFISSFDTFIDQ